jgi:hypothetical protein
MEVTIQGDEMRVTGLYCVSFVPYVAPAQVKNMLNI